VRFWTANAFCSEFLILPLTKAIRCVQTDLPRASKRRDTRCMRRSVPIIAAALVFTALFSRSARADEFKLKDGSTVVGTVVGYQGNSFKVKTSYGYALVEKDKIVSIKIASAPEPAAEKKSSSSTAENQPKPPKPATKHAQEAKLDEHASDKSSEKPAVALKTKSDAAAPPPTAPATAAASANAPPPEATTAAPVAQNAAAVSAPVVPPEPQPIREKVTGNTYINDTYEFEMYKPPDWQVMDGARSVLPGAVAAMGTDDQSTYLVIGQQAAGKSTAADIAATQKRLSDILVNFRPLDDEHLTVSGLPLIAHRFRGSVDEHDWSGFMVFMPRGDKLYTIFGMTRADNDLVQIQENVIRRTIASFQFLPE
jgi:hypothetical protein